MWVRNLGVFTAIVFIAVPSVALQIYEVDTTADLGFGACTAAQIDCPLRGAITLANTDMDDSVIVLADETYQLTIPGPFEDNNATGDLDVTQSLEITVLLGATPVIEQTEADRVLDIQPNSGTVRILGPITITGGEITGAGSGNGGGINASAHGDLELEDVILMSNHVGFDGGCLSYSGTAAGTLTLTRVTLVDCLAEGNGGGAYLNLPGGGGTMTSSLVDDNTAYVVGGGLYLTGSAGMVILDTTIRENLAGFPGTGEGRGGGIYRIGGNTVLRQSTVSGNQAGVGTTVTATGGGLHIILNTSFLVENSTISGNDTSGTSQSGAGIYVDTMGFATLDHASVVDNPTRGEAAILVFGPGNAGLTVKNSIIDDGCSGHSPNITTSGFNVERPWDGSTNTTCNLTDPSDMQVTNLLLWPLAGYGGPTYTHSLHPSSPAQSLVSSAQCQAEDQRHAVRQGLFCDSGAFDDSSLPPGPWIFSDGFESGDTAAWSSSSP